MKFMRELVYCFCIVLLALAAGCGGKKEAKTELEKTADALAKSEGAQPAPAATPAPAAAEPALPMPSEEPGAPPTTPAQQVRQALVSYKAGQLEDAVTRLQKLRATRALTPEQRMALQDSIAAVMNEVYEMAAKGNTRAIQAVRQYEEMQNQRR